MSSGGVPGLRIRKFNPGTIKPHRIIFLVGKRHTGKSFLMKDLLSQMPKPDFVMAMTPTDDSMETFRTFMPETCIFSGFSQEKLERLLSLQRELLRRGKQRSVLLLMDDCMYQKGVLKSQAMRDVFFNGRHLGISLVVTAQYLMDISPELRSNIDYLFALRENTMTNRQKMHKHFFGLFSSFATFESVMSATTQNYSALVLDATVPSTHATDCVFWYRARTVVPPFKLGRDVYWRLARQCGKTEAAMREAQRLQFEIEAAALDAPPLPSGSKGAVVVQTEDEHGKVIVAG
jgi:hypothetical protein